MGATNDSMNILRNGAASDDIILEEQLEGGKEEYAVSESCSKKEDMSSQLPVDTNITHGGLESLQDTAHTFDVIISPSPMIIQYFSRMNILSIP